MVLCNVFAISLGVVTILDIGRMRYPAKRIMLWSNGRSIVIQPLASKAAMPSSDILGEHGSQDHGAESSHFYIRPMAALSADEKADESIGFLKFLHECVKYCDASLNLSENFDKADWSARMVDRLTSPNASTSVTGPAWFDRLL